MTRYARGCGQYSDFLERGQLLSEKLPRDKSNLGKLASSLRKFYVRHRELGDICFANYQDFVTIWRSSRAFFTTDFDFHQLWPIGNTTGVADEEEHAYLSGEPDVTICFYESSYIVQALVLSVFVLLCFCMFPCRFCLILLPLVAMLNFWSIWI